jgi:hypothetical protein
MKKPPINKQIFIKNIPISTSSIVAIFSLIAYIVKWDIAADEIKLISLGVFGALTIAIAIIRSRQKSFELLTEMKQNESKTQILLSGMKESLDRIERRDKYDEFAEDLAFDIKTKVKQMTRPSVSDIAGVTKAVNSELAKSLRNASKQLIVLIKDMLKADFRGMSYSEMMFDLDDAADLVGDNIDYEKLNISNFRDFKDRLNESQAIIFKNFAVAVEDILKKYENGKRQTPFSDACLDFTGKIINNALSVHSEFNIKKNDNPDSKRAI